MFPSPALDGDLYLSQTDNTNQWISVSKFENGQYLQPEKLSDSVNFNSFTGHSCIGADESYLIFDALDHMAGSTICRDLYICYKKPDSTWSGAKSLGDSINTYDGNEVCPFVSRDNRYLFFSRGGTLYWVSAAAFLPQTGIEEKSMKAAGPVFRRIFPNPAVQNVTADFSLRGKTKISLVICDLTGTPLKTILDEEWPAGDHSVSFNTGFLGPGIYFLVLSGNNHKATGKLAVQK